MTQASRTLSQSVLQDARAQLDAGFLEEARKTLEPLSSESPDLPVENPLLFWRDAAEVLRNAGMADASIAAWGRARSAGLNPMVAETESALAQLVAGRFDPGPFRVLAESHPRNAVIRNLYALALFESGEREAALAEWEGCRRFSAHKECPLSTEPVHLSLGAMALERFLLENPPAPDPLPADPPERAPGRTRQSRIGRITRAFDHQDFDTALRWMDAEAALPDNRNLLEINLLRALILEAKNRWAEARLATTQVLETPNAPPLAESLLAHCLTRTGEPRTALAILENVQPTGPDDYFRHYFQGCAHLALGDRIRALHAFQKAFRNYFFDNYHEILVPAWERMTRRVRA